MSNSRRLAGIKACMDGIQYIFITARKLAGTALHRIDGKRLWSLKASRSISITVAALVLVAGCFPLGAKPLGAFRVETDGRILLPALECPSRVQAEQPFLDAVVRTREFLRLAEQTGNTAPIALRGPDEGRVSRVGSQCLALVAVYVDRPARLEMRLVFGVDVITHDVYVQDENGDFLPTEKK